MYLHVIKIKQTSRFKVGNTHRLLNVRMHTIASHDPSNRFLRACSLLKTARVAAFLVSLLLRKSE